MFCLCSILIRCLFVLCDAHVCWFTSVARQSTKVGASEAAINLGYKIRSETKSDLTCVYDV